MKETSECWLMQLMSPYPQTPKLAFRNFGAWGCLERRLFGRASHKRRTNSRATPSPRDSEERSRKGSPRRRPYLKIVLFVFLPLIFCMKSAYADFVINAVSTVEYEVAKPRDALRAFDQPEFISRNLPGLRGIKPAGEDLHLWDMEIKVPLSKPMRGTFLARRIPVDDNVIHYESADKNAPDYMFCETAVIPKSAGESSVKITIQLKFTRSSGWKFHWMAPLLGERFIGSKVKERLDGMLKEFVANSKREMEGA